MLKLRQSLLSEKCKYVHQFSKRVSRSFNTKTEFEKFKEELATYASGEITLSKENGSGVAQIILDNPSAKNAISGSMAIQLNEVITTLEKWNEGRVVIFSGSNNQFCSGGDLKNFMSRLDTPQKGAMMCEYMQKLMLRFSALPYLNVALIQGSTLGGGAELAVGCDVRLMQEDAVLGFIQAKMGLTTGFGGGANLVELVGRQKAMQILIECKIMTATEARDIGLVDDIMPINVNPIDWSTNWLSSKGYLTIHPELLQNVKMMTLSAAALNRQDSLENERTIFHKFWMGRLHKEAISRNIKHR